MKGSKQQGFSMVELMVAMVIGLLLVAAVLQTFISAKRGYEMQDDLSRIQENGRFAMEYLKEDIRQADFWGCMSGAVGNIANNLNSGVDEEFFSMSEGVSGAEGSGYMTDVTKLGAQIFSDKIILRGGSGSGIHVETPYMPTTAGALHVDTGSGLEQGDIILVSDCNAGDIFQLTTDPSGGSTKETLTHGTGGSVSPGNADKDFEKKYQGDAQIFRAGTTTYEIKANSFGEPALYRNGDEELVEGVESMQIQYGIDTDGDGVPNYFNSFDASEVDDAVSVQISLLVRGYKDNLADSNYSLTYGDGDGDGVVDTFTTQDRRLRKVFTSTIALRNRLP